MTVMKVTWGRDRLEDALRVLDEWWEGRRDGHPAAHRLNTQTGVLPEVLWPVRDLLRRHLDSLDCDEAPFPGAQPSPWADDAWLGELSDVPDGWEARTNLDDGWRPIHDGFGDLPGSTLVEARCQTLTVQIPMPQAREFITYQREGTGCSSLLDALADSIEAALEDKR